MSLLAMLLPQLAVMELPGANAKRACQHSNRGGRRNDQIQTRHHRRGLEQVIEHVDLFEPMQLDAAGFRRPVQFRLAIVVLKVHQADSRSLEYVLPLVERAALQSACALQIAAAPTESDLESRAQRGKFLPPIRDA